RGVLASMLAEEQLAGEEPERVVDLLPESGDQVFARPCWLEAVVPLEAGRHYVSTTAVSPEAGRKAEGSAPLNASRSGGRAARTRVRSRASATMSSRPCVVSCW